MKKRRSLGSYKNEYGKAKPFRTVRRQSRKKAPSLIIV